MRDYTYRGTPVAQMRNEDIRLCLREGVQIDDGQGDPRTVAEQEAAVLKRLKLELLIRTLGLRG